MLFVIVGAAGFCIAEIRMIVTIAAIETFIIHFHCPGTHTHTRESPVVKKVLHGYFPGQITEKGQALIGTFVGSSISQRRHSFCEIHEPSNPLHAATGCCEGWRL